MAASARDRALSNASMAATRLNRDLKIDQSRPIDVFGIAQRLGLWLMAQPLDRLYGAYVRNAEQAGVLVNSQHPESLQRFTVAHEIGHHILGHGHTADDQANVSAFTGTALEEAQAQTFASSLLLPLPLINRTVRELSPGRELSASEVYMFSRQTGVSYTAAVWTLLSRGRLSYPAAQRLTKRGAAAAKTELRGETWVDDARADVWVLGEDDSGLEVMCRVGDEIHVRLPENLSTGLAWQIDRPAVGGQFARSASTAAAKWADDAMLVIDDESVHDVDGPISATATNPRLARDIHLGSDGSIVGREDIEDDPVADLFLWSDEADQSRHSTTGPEWPAPPGLGGTRALVFVAQAEGGSQIDLSLRPPWADAAPDQAYHVGVRARAHSRLAGVGLAQPTRDAWARTQSLSA